MIFLTSLPHIYWISLATFKFMVSRKAAAKPGTRGGQLMYMSSLAQLLIQFSNAFLVYNYPLLDSTSTGATVYYSIIGTVGYVAAVLFLVGLYRFVLSAGGPKPGRHLVDHY